MRNKIEAPPNILQKFETGLQVVVGKYILKIVQQVGDCFSL